MSTKPPTIPPDPTLPLPAVPGRAQRVGKSAWGPRDPQSQPPQRAAVQDPRYNKGYPAYNPNADEG